MHGSRHLTDMLRAFGLLAQARLCAANLHSTSYQGTP
jgi:hypothetical protein